MQSVALAVLFVLGAAAAQAGPIYTFEILDEPGAKHTLAEDFNDAGVIVGYSIDASGNTAHAFVRDAAGYSTFKVLDAFDAVPFGINNAGLITGFYITDDPVVFWSGFVKSGDAYSVFNVPGAVATIPTGINDAGQIIGTWMDGAGSHGFLKDGESYSDITFPGATFTQPEAINNAGDIVGSYLDIDGVSHGFIKRGDEYLSLNLLSGATGINDAGLIAGVVNGSNGVVTDGVHLAHIVLLQPYNGSTPTDIDNFGHVLGNTSQLNPARIHGFLATPTPDWMFEPEPPPPSIPEPASLWLCGLGLTEVVRRYTAARWRTGS
jgi:uncharacterized membrane protein